MLPLFYGYRTDLWPGYTHYRHPLDWYWEPYIPTDQHTATIQQDIEFPHMFWIHHTPEQLRTAGELRSKVILEGCSIHTNSQCEGIHCHGEACGEACKPMGGEVDRYDFTLIFVGDVVLISMVLPAN